MDDRLLLSVLHDAADAVRHALDRLDDWGETEGREGEYRSDLAADEAILAVLDRAGLGAMSEESGLHHPERPIVVVVDPVDGSTNASRDLPWYATSLCAVDADGARAAVVVDQASSVRFEAVRGGGARCDGEPMHPSGATDLAESLIGLSGFPPRYFGWKQFRAFGAVALDLCAVAAGRFDGYVDCSPGAHGSWDYLGAMLVCEEAGAPVVDALGRPLVTTDHDARRTPIAAATPELLERLVAERRRFVEHPLWASERDVLAQIGDARSTGSTAP